MTVNYLRSTVIHYDELLLESRYGQMLVIRCRHAGRIQNTLSGSYDHNTARHIRLFLLEVH